ncbi:aldehyde oxidase and xanthine dehydrogenase a/b hammerhead [Proteiniborus sp. DW1]|nr:aldehyde oxidase and xanthine dehydrogenase a/b hammerhead [Proteiniborus sp. DW1]
MKGGTRVDNLNIIGKSVEKKDSLSKAIGTAIFSADIELDNMLYGSVKRSTVASAILKNIDTSKAKALPGVAAVLTYKDIPGDNRVGIIIKDEPILVDDKIRRIGDALAIVAAETKEIAEEALDLIEVEYEELEGIFTIEDALKEGVHAIHGNSNVLQNKDLIFGDVDEAFKQCDVIVEDTYKTNYFAHMFIEPEAGVAKYENGILTFWSSTQNPHFDRGEVARMLKLPQSKVRSIQATTGGGFGGKLDISVQCHAALLAYYTGRPVKFVRSREESMKVSSKRHPMTLKLKTGATRDGKILALDAHITGDTGAYASYGPAVIGRAMTHLTGPYEIPNVRVKATFVYTNNPMAGAFRGFGVPQAAIAHEGQMDLLAKKLGMDPIELRLKNALRVGSVTSTGQLLTDGVGIVETIEKAVEKAKEVIFTEGEVK